MSLIQRDGRPKLHILPDDDSRISKDWSDPIGGEHCQEDYGDLGAAPANKPWPPRKGGPDVDGWQKEVIDFPIKGEK